MNYQQHWIIDNLPVIWCYQTEDNNEYCSRGFPVGCYVSKNGQKKDACRIYVSGGEGRVLNKFSKIIFLARF